MYPDINRWQELFLAAVNNRVARLIKEKKISDAYNFLENQKEHITEANYAQLDSLILDADLLHRANNFKTAAEGDEIIAKIEQAGSGGRLNEKRTSELITYVIQITAKSLCAAPLRDWRAAVRYLGNALSKYGANRELEQSLRTYKGNLATDYHNRFAAEWNRKNFEEAERVLDEGLTEFPNDRQLLNDKQSITKQGR
jgi:tetratricopeptide (TPR) repeat protein